MATVTKSKDAPEDAFHWTIPGADITLDGDNAEFVTDDPAVITGLQNDPEFDVHLDDPTQAVDPAPADVVDPAPADAVHKWGEGS